MPLIVSHFYTPWGVFEVQYDEQRIHQAYFPISEPLNVNEIDRSASLSHPLFFQIDTELKRYFKNPHHRFQLPLKPHGSVFQQRVWNALLVVPAGRTVTYGELARTLQTSPRAIGQACKSNPLTLFIPCHRVVGRTSLGGYMGIEEAVSFKQALLQHEGLMLTDKETAV